MPTTLQQKEGFFVLSLKDGTALSARKLEACPEGVMAEIGGLTTLFPAEEIGKTWQVKGDLPVQELEHFSDIGAALVSLENALTTYRKDTGRDPFSTTGSPLVLGATPLAFTLAPLRSSEDLDLVVSQDFLNWTESNWNPPLDFSVDLCSEDSLGLCGVWRERTVAIAGLTEVRFRLLHPLDLVAWRLLRRDDDTFFGRDVPHIEAVIERLNPPEETLVALLSESAQRYNPTPNDPTVPSQHEAVMRNTYWFLGRFLPGVTLDEIVKRAWARKGAALRKIGLAPGVP